MAVYSGNFNYAANRPDLGDGDEQTFNVSASGPITLNFNIDSAGSLSGSASVTSSVNGSAPDDTDGDDDSFADSGSGTGSVAGSLGAGVRASGTLNTGGSFSFQGTFANQASTINGTITITDPNLPGSVATNVSLSGPPSFPSTPVPANIDTAGETLSGIFEGLADQFATKATQAILKSTKGLSLLGNPPPTTFPSGLKSVLNFLGEEVHGNALPWGNVGSAATSAVVGKVLTLADVFEKSYQVGQTAYQNGVLSTPALQADVKLAAAMATGYVGELVSGGAVAGYVGGLLASAEVAPAAAGLLAAGAGFVAPVAVGALVGYGIYTIGNYLINGQQKSVVDGVDVCGPQDVTNQAQPYLSPAPGSNMPGSASGLIALGQAASSDPLNFGNAVLQLGSAAPQAAWVFNADTGTFTWLGSSSAPLTQALSQMGVTQFAAPLTISGGIGGGELITGGPDGDHLSVGTGGNNVIIGGSGSNLISSGPGNNVLDGGVGGINTLDYSAASGTVIVNLSQGVAQNGYGGIDSFADFQLLSGSVHATSVAVFGGSRSQYRVSPLGGGTHIVDQRTGSPDGSDTFFNFQQFQFANATYTLDLIRGTHYDFNSDGTSDIMIRRSSDGLFDILDVGNNKIAGLSSLGQVGNEWQVSGYGDFVGNGSSDMMIRRTTDGAFQILDVNGNKVTGVSSAGQVGNEWQVAGFGDFSGDGISDMMIRRGSDGAFQILDISNNKIAAVASAGQVGPEWQVAGFGDFVGDGSSDMLMRRSTDGSFAVFDISNNKITGANIVGQVGNEWQVAGLGDFNGDGTTDILIRRTTDGAFTFLDVNANKIIASGSMGQIGNEWQVQGFGDFVGDGESDMLMRRSTDGTLAIFDIHNNKITATNIAGQVGLEWKVTTLG